VVILNLKQKNWTPFSNNFTHTTRDRMTIGKLAVYHRRMLTDRINSQQCCKRFASERWLRDVVDVCPDVIAVDHYVSVTLPCLPTHTAASPSN